jgi:hypothetical protein
MVLDNKFKMMDIVTEYKACFLILKLVYGWKQPETCLNHKHNTTTKKNHSTVKMF